MKCGAGLSDICDQLYCGMSENWQSSTTEKRLTLSVDIGDFLIGDI